MVGPGHALLLGDCVVEEELELVHLRGVVVSVQLFVGAVLVSEHAASAVHARLRVVESPTVLRLILSVICLYGSHGEFFLTVSKTALVLKAAPGCLDPVLAELSLVLAIWVAHRVPVVVRVVCCTIVVAVSLLRAVVRSIVILDVKAVD